MQALRYLVLLNKDTFVYPRVQIRSACTVKGFNIARRPFYNMKHFILRALSALVCRSGARALGSITLGHGARSIGIGRGCLLRYFGVNKNSGSRRQCCYERRRRHPWCTEGLANFSRPISCRFHETFMILQSFDCINGVTIS